MNFLYKSKNTYLDDLTSNNPALAADNIDSLAHILPLIRVRHILDVQVGHHGSLGHSLNVEED